MQDEDFIQSLPATKSEPKIEEMYMVNSLFATDSGVKEVKSVLHGLKDVLLAGLLFIIFSIPVIDKVICGLFKFTTNSQILCIVMKVILFMILLFFIQNFALSRL